MSGLTLNLNVKGLGLTKQQLKRLKSSGLDLRKPLDLVGQYLVSETQSKFVDNKIKPQTKKFGIKKVVEIKGGKKKEIKLKVKGQTLLERGHLMQSITHHVSGHEVEVGTNVVYAAIHQFGGRAGRQHASVIPARPFLGVSQQDKNEIKHIFIDYIDKKI
jgi:phage virion morphogenesis protein